MRILREGEKGFYTYLSNVEERITDDSTRLEKEVKSILKDVKDRGDRALLHYTKCFDGVRLTPSQIMVRDDEIEDARLRVSYDFYKTLKRSAHRIRKFHKLYWILKFIKTNCKKQVTLHRC